MACWIRGFPASIIPMKVRLPTTLLRSVDQRIIRCLAGQSRYFGTVIILRQLSIRSDRPVEQVGEHHSGAGGCLAAGYSGGIRAGATDGGSELGAFVAQLLENGATISSLGFFMGMGPRLLLLLDASECMRGLAGGLGKGVLKGCGGYKSP